MLSDIDADISTDGKKNSVNFLFTSLPFLAGSEDILSATLPPPLYTYTVIISLFHNIFNLYLLIFRNFYLCVFLQNL